LFLGPIILGLSCQHFPATGTGVRFNNLNFPVRQRRPFLPGGSQTTLRQVRSTKGLRKVAPPVTTPARDTDREDHGPSAGRKKPLPVPSPKYGDDGNPQGGR